MTAEDIKRIYAGYSNIYDFVFKKFFHPRHKHVIEQMNIRPDDKILDVGVGTGLALPLYPDYCHVTGIDLSEEMLKKAHKKVKKHYLKNVTLKQMDAMNLQFNNNTFDQVIATFVISVVPDPVKVISEMKRVCKKNCNLIIINHFQSNNKYMAKIEDMVNPICRKIGWRTDVDLDYLISESNLLVNSKYKMTKFDLWKVVMAVNNK
ncbi:MAG TPA: methyltransferase domain-containing protein [Nitrospinota bacterium]|nr:methyltransferase domain-containing protein [Nitrospinota bacterium]